MYRVIQIRKNIKAKDPTLWCTTDDFNFLHKFCQYLIDSTIPEGLNEFRIFQTRDADEKGFEAIEKEWRFSEFCKVQKIRKRTFEERL